MLNAGAGQRGMSIIEVMVALTLAALLMALGAPSFIKGAQSRQIRTAADGLQTGLQLAKTEALRRNRNVKFTLRDQSGWTVGCETVDATMVGTEQACPATILVREASEGSANAITATTEVGSGAAAFTDGLTFTPLGRVASSTLGTGNNLLFNVTNPKGGDCVADGGEMRCLQIIVSSGGQIRMCDPAVAAGDPRSCS